MRQGTKWKLSGHFLGLLMAALLAACGDGGGGAATPGPGADAVKLHDFITRQDLYTSWDLWPETSKFYPGREPHGALLITYVNDIAANSILAQNGMADGSIIVKENLTPLKALAGLTVMYKIRGFDPSAGDWFWAEYAPDGTVASSGQVAKCIDCHVKVQENDFLFTGNVMNGGAVPSPGVTVSFDSRILSIFNAKCGVCHNAGGPAAFLSLTSDAAYVNLVNKPSTTTGTPPSGALVIPGNSANSVLYQRVSNIGLPAGDERMPLGRTLSTGDQNIIKAWIDQGANNN